MNSKMYYIFLLLIILNSILFAGDGMQINMNAKVHFIIVDPLGRETGRNPILNKRYNEIPKANYGNSGVDDHDSFDEVEYSREFVTGSSYPPIDGLYQLKIIGVSSGEYEININIKRGSRRITQNKIGYSKAGEAFLYQFDYKSNPDSAIVLVRITESASDIKRDVNILYEQDLITNQGIYNSLTKKVENAEKKYVKDQTNAAINQLNAFVNEVEAQRGKHIKEDAAIILLEDVQYLIKLWEQ